MAGIYIHIPFCRQACTYCNFHFSTSTALKADFISSLIKEIGIPQEFIDGDELIDTIYFGGGTPSLLHLDEIQCILDALNKHFKISANAEITLEANPDDVAPVVLKEWLNIGINRLSLGVQSFNEEELKYMNRAHTAIESRRSIDDILEAGFTNFSIDLIFGSPFLNLGTLETNLDIIFSKKVPHVSCYALTVEPKTILNKLIEQKKVMPVNSEEQSEQFLLLMKKMREQGFEHYEISNFAQPGMRSRHNSSYWQGKPYYGFGPSAHSFNGSNKRRWNISNNSLYIKSLQQNLIPFEEEILTQDQKLNEYIMTGLRTKEGINLNFIRDKYGIKFSEDLQVAAKKHIGSNRMIEQNNHLFLTNEGKLFADGIASDLFV